MGEKELFEKCIDAARDEDGNPTENLRSVFRNGKNWTAYLPYESFGRGKRQVYFEDFQGGDLWSYCIVLFLCGRLKGIGFGTDEWIECLRRMKFSTRFIGYM